MKIGVFDSGVGGLTVLKELVQAFPAETFLFLGDTARLPYGTKSPATIRQYSEQVMNYLVGQKVDAIVIACNTASSQVKELEWKGIPVFNVIRPGSEAALRATKTKRIGVLATRATVESESYAQKIKSLAPDAQVFSQASSLLVPLAEEGWIDDPVTDQVISRYVTPLLQNQIDTLILGCTHFPILKNAIQKVCGDSIKLVDSGEAICVKMRASLGDRLGKDKNAVHTHIHIDVTDLPKQVRVLAEKILHPFSPGQIELVQL